MFERLGKTKKRSSYYCRTWQTLTVGLCGTWWEWSNNELVWGSGSNVAHWLVDLFLVWKVESIWYGCGRWVKSEHVTSQTKLVAHLRPAIICSWEEAQPLVFLDLVADQGDSDGRQTFTEIFTIFYFPLVVKYSILIVYFFRFSATVHAVEPNMTQVIERQTTNFGPKKFCGCGK